MNYSRRLMLFILCLVAPISISNGIFNDKAQAADAMVLKGKLGSFYAQIYDSNGTPISNEYISVGPWGVVTSPNGIIYLGKLPEGKYAIVPYIGGAKGLICDSFEINASAEFIKRYYIYDLKTKSLSIQ